MILPVILSLLGFGAILSIDLGPLRRRGAARVLVVLVGGAALAIAYRQTLAQAGPGLGLREGWAGIGWFLSILGGLLLLYSLLLEIPLTLRCRERAGVEAAPALVTTGTYALCRHPGFLWFLIFAGGQVLLHNRLSVLLLLLCWAALDLAVVVVQDWLIFPTLFPGYAHYKTTTPMLAPTRACVAQAIDTLACKEAKR